MKMRYQVSGLFAVLMLAGCQSYDAVLKTGSNDIYTHEINVVEDMVVLEVPMTQSEPGLPYYEQNRVKAFLADYKTRGLRHGPLVLSLPMNSPWGPKLESSANHALALADQYGVRDLKRSDYESNGSAEAPLVLAFSAYRAIPPKCRSLATINMAATHENDTLPTFGCAMQSNLAVMVAEPADLLGARASDPADLIRRATVLQKYRAGEPTATERAEGESGAIAQAID